MSQDGVQVHIGVGKQEGKGKAGAALPEVQQADAGDCSTCQAWPSKCLWTAFLLGWVFPPAWWAGVAGGLRCGKDNECLVKRRKLQTTSASIAWACNLLMSLVSPVVLILVLSIVYGRPGPAQDGPYYIAMSGAGDAFPDFSDPANLLKMSQAVYAALSLPSSYPLSGISMWLDSSSTLEPAPARRRLLADPPSANDTLAAVLGYTLVKTPDLPPRDALAALIEDGTAVDEVSAQLVSVGLVKPEHVGKLQLGLLPAGLSHDRLAQLLSNTGAGAAAFVLVPVGKRCKGNWTEWTACEGCGNRTRTFTILPRAEEAEAEAEPQAPASSRRLQRAGGNGNGNSEDAGNGRNSQQPPHWMPNGAALGNLLNQAAAQMAGFAQQILPGASSQGPQGQQSHSQGLAHAFGLGHGLALALGQIECPVLNNTVEAEACTETCPGYCADAPGADVAFTGVAFEWDCASGSYNDTACTGTCTTIGEPAFAGIAEALCLNSTYQLTSQNCSQT